MATRLRAVAGLSIPPEGWQSALGDIVAGMRVRHLLSVALSLCAWMVPLAALADTSVAVLGIQSIEGDEQSAGQITAAIRVGVGTISGYDLLPTDATLAQMVLAHDCEEEPNEGCLANIASALSAERLVFGQLRRVSVGASNYRFQLTLTVFNRQTGRTERTFRQSVERTASAEALRDLGRTSARQLLGVSATGGGTIVVTSSVLAATVQLDGQTVGQTSDDPLVLRGVPEGRHQLAVTAPGRRPFTRAVTVEEGETEELEAELPVLTGPTPYDDGRRDGRDRDDDGGSDLRWLGWVGVGVGAAAGVLALVSYLQWSDTGRGGNETAFDDYTRSVCPGPGCAMSAGTYEIEDVCTHAETSADSSDRTRVLDICDRGDTFQTLQYVAMGVGVVAVTAGVIGILTLGPDDDRGSSDRAFRPPPRARLAPRLTPVVSPQGAGLSARLIF